MMGSRAGLRLMSVVVVVCVCLATTATSLAAPSRTRVRFAASVSRDHHRLKRDVVTLTRRGHCEPGSDSVPGPVYRCFYGNHVVDPCWAVLRPRRKRHTVLCMPRPWSHHVIRLHPRRLPRTLQPPEYERNLPWGVRLTNGRHCVAVQGAHDQFRGRVVDYVCGRRYHLVLLGGIHQNKPLWHFDSAIWNGSRYRRGPSEAVAVAWFGGWRGEPRLKVG